VLCSAVLCCAVLCSTTGGSADRSADGADSDERAARGLRGRGAGAHRRGEAYGVREESGGVESFLEIQ
jgi:hypothetical protein